MRQGCRLSFEAGGGAKVRKYVDWTVTIARIAADMRVGIAPGVDGEPPRGDSGTKSREGNMMNTATIREDIDPLALRHAMGRFASGVTVVTGADDEGPLGFTCQSFHSVSLDPPLISICVMRSSSTYPRIHAAGHFVVNVLQHGQRELSQQFARRGADKWAGVEWAPSERGLPVLADSLMWVECRVSVEYDAGDHLMVLGEVLGFGGTEDERLGDRPLVFFNGGYRGLDRQ